jgi:hypothetical protein
MFPEIRFTSLARMKDKKPTDIILLKIFPFTYMYFFQVK